MVKEEQSSVVEPILKALPTVSKRLIAVYLWRLELLGICYSSNQSLEKKQTLLGGLLQQTSLYSRMHVRCDQPNLHIRKAPHLILCLASKGRTLEQNVKLHF
jgi:hypothetical protein